MPTIADGSEVKSAAGITQTASWQVPPFEAPPQERASWVSDQILESEGFLEGLNCYQDWGKNLRIYNGLFKDKTKSSLITNELRYDVKKFCETLAEVREIAEYGSDNPAYKKFAEMLNKVAKAVYLESDFPSQILKVLQYAAVLGVGYLWPKVIAEDYGWGPRKMVFDAYGLLDVLPVQMPRSNDIQDCYSVTCISYVPIAEAYGRWPLFQGKLQAVGYRNFQNQVQARRQDFAERYRYGEATRKFGELYTEIRYTWVRDLRINNTGLELPMGDVGCSWFYKVPTLGQEIFGKVIGGKPVNRTAMAEDCRVYPNLRLIITSNGLDVPMYDGPAYDWDPKIPLIQYTVDDTAWEPMGRSIVGDVGPIETTIRKLERKADQIITARANPPMGYNLDDIGGPKIEHFDIFEEDVRVGVSGEPKKTVQSLLPDEVKVEDAHFKFLEYLGVKRDKQLGLQDLGNLANMKMNISSPDAMDKAVEAIGAVGRGIAFRIEKSNKAVGNRFKYLIVQWYDDDRLMAYLDPKDFSAEMFDYNPKELTPSHMPDELINGVIPSAPSHYDQLTRARWFVKQMRLLPTSGTLIKITQQQEQLKYLTLKRTPDCPVSWETVLTKLNVRNPQQEMDKYYQEVAKMEKMKLLVMAEVAAEMKKLGIQPPEQGESKQLSGAHPGGRPATNAKPARLSQKGKAGGVPRPVVKTS